MKFIELANQIKDEIEMRGDQYTAGYQEILRLIQMYPNIPDESSIGVAGVKMYDSGSAQDNHLSHLMSELSFMIHRKTYKKAG